jgi:dephospho-CoA kinase
MSNEERRKHADVVINNDGDLMNLKARVGELWYKIHTEGARRPSEDT